MNLQDRITEYQDFPKEGVLFRDYTPLLADPSALSYVADEFARYFHPKDVDIFAGIESRGFILACLLASRYGKGMVPLRKKGKLPGKTRNAAYKTEYSSDALEIQNDSITKGQKVVICDDLLATGGTAKAAASLVEKSKGIVSGFAFIIELTDLGGAGKISKYDYKSLVKY